MDKAKAEKSTRLSILENQIDTISKRDHLHDYADIQNAGYFGSGTRTSHSLRFVSNQANELIIDSSHK